MIERQKEYSLGRANAGSSMFGTQNSKGIETPADKQYVQNTSLEALPPKLKREAQNRQVWYFLRALPNSTMKEISKDLNLGIQVVCWRIHDLREEGSIEESYRDKEIHWRIKVQQRTINDIKEV